MKTIAYNNHIIELYDSVEDMPMVNFQKYNKFLLVDSGLGSDADDIDAHIVKVARLIGSNDLSKALQELQNMRQNLYLVNCEISPRYLAFAALIKRVDKKEITDLSDDNLRKVLKSINDIKHNVVIDFLSRFKKKISDELIVYFPSDFALNSKEKEFGSNIKAKLVYELKEIIEEKDYSRNICDIENRVLNMYKPGNFDGSGSDEIAYDKNFESSCLLISQKLNADARKMTVLQFYNALSIIKAQADAEAKACKKHKK